MKYCPKHIENSLVDATSAFADSADEFHHYFQVSCACGSEKFAVLKSNRSSVRAVCNECKKEHQIYDLANYPAATKVTGEEVYLPLDESDQLPTKVYVGFEYSELDEDEEYNRDDITWFELFVEREGSIAKVFDDETA